VFWIQKFPLTFIIIIAFGCALHHIIDVCTRQRLTNDGTPTTPTFFLRLPLLSAGRTRESDASQRFVSKVVYVVFHWGKEKR